MAAAEDNPTGDSNPVAEPSYRGVTKRGPNSYRVGIRSPFRKRRWIGTFENAEVAARAYDAMAIKLRGDKAKTNFPHPAAAAIPSRSSTLELSSSAVSCTSFEVVESEKGLGFDLNLPPPLVDLNLPPPPLVDLNLPPPLED